MNKFVIYGYITVGSMAIGLFTTALSGPVISADSTKAEQPTEKSQNIAAAKHPYNEEAIKHYNRGHDLHQQGFFNQAIAEYKLALSYDNRMEEAYTNLGLIYAAQRNFNKAIDAFNKSLEINPRRTNALNGLGTVLFAKNKFKDAMERWQEAVKIDPRFASAYYNMGNALENEKEYTQAINFYVKALSIAPTMADPYYRIGVIYARQKHEAQAAVLLTKAIQLQPDAEFAHDAKKSLDEIKSEMKNAALSEQEVKMNIVVPPTAQADNPASSKVRSEAAAIKTGGM